MKILQNFLMRFSFAGFFLILWSPAHADWVQVVSSGDTTVYSDVSGRQRQGDLVKMWSMTDYKQPQAFKKIAINSDKSLDEYDCTKRRLRVLSTEAYSSRMGRGNVVHRDSSKSPWIPISSGNGSETLWNIACTRLN